MEQVRIGRRAYFSCGHSYRREGLSPQQSQEIWGELYVPGGFGHNFVIEAHILAQLPDATGLSFSLPQVDTALAQVTEELDHTYLNNDVPFFQDRVPSLENLAVYVFSQLGKHLGSKLQLERLRLYEDEHTWAEKGSSEEVTLTQIFKVSALHRHHNPDLTAEENLALYTKCATLHGHQYICEVSFKGVPDPVSGLVVKREDFKRRVGKVLVEPFRGQILNDIIGNTSGELLYREFDKRLGGEFGVHYGGLLLRETRKNHFQAARA